MAFCGKCGNQVPDGNKFCSKCGTPIGGAVTPASSAPVKPAVVKATAPSTPKKVKKAKKESNVVMVIAIILGVLVLIAGLSVGGYYVYNNVISADKSDEDDEDDKKKKKDEDDEDEASEDIDEEEADEEEPEEVEAEPAFIKEDVIEEAYDALVLKNIDGKKLNYRAVRRNGYDSHVPENLGEEGYIYASSESTDDGEPVMYDVRVTDDGDDTVLVLEAVTVSDDASLLEEQVSIGTMAGENAPNDFLYRVLRMDDQFVISYDTSYSVDVDGHTEGIKILKFKNGKWDITFDVDASGTDIGSPDWEDFFIEKADELRNAGLTKTARAIDNGYMGFDVASDEDVTPVIAVAGKLRGTENWDYDEFYGSIFQMYDVRDEYIFPDSSREYLSEDEVSRLSSTELRYARNEIYARRGRKFKDEELQKYFNNKFWYNGYVDEVPETALSDIEKANRDLISSYE